MLSQTTSFEFMQPTFSPYMNSTPDSTATTNFTFHNYENYFIQP